MIRFVVFLSLFSLTSFCFSSEKSLQKLSPKIEIPHRHLKFQAGKLGDKPWNFDASFGVYTNFVGAVFTKLLYVDSRYRLSPGIFKTWSWSFKDKSFEFELDESLAFDNNRKLSAKDVEFAILKVFLSDKGKPYRDRLHQIVGIESIRPGMNFKSGMCEGLKIVGDSRIKIFLKKENPDFLFNLENGIPSVAPVEDFSSDMFNFSGTPRGTGKYFVEWSDPNSSLIRLKIKNYAAEKLNVGYFPLTIDFYNEGEAIENLIDLATAAGSSGIRDNENYTTVLGKVPESIGTLDFNFNHPLSKNKLLRKAIACALNRDKINKQYQQNKVTFTLVPSKYLGRSNKYPDCGPSDSIEIVKKNFSKTSSKQKPLKGIFHGVPGKPKKPHILEIEKQLEAVGIFIDFQGRKVLIQFGEDKDAFIKENGNSVSFVDPLSSVSRFIPFPGELNLIASPESPQLLKLFRQAEMEVDQAKRANLINLLSSQLESNFYTIPISEGYPVFSYNRRVRDIGLESIFAAIDFTKVQLDGN